MTRSIRRLAFLCAALGAGSVAWAAMAEAPNVPRPGAPVGGKPPAGGKPASAPTPQEPQAVEDIYKAAKMRDPFVPVEGGGSALAVAPMNMEDFSIHALVLKGIMEDKGGAFAILIDPKYNASFVLKRGRLLNFKNHPVPGVTGVIKARQKMVQLISADKDVQVLVLGEAEGGK